MSSRECPCAAVRCSGSLPSKPARRSCSKPSARSRGACSCSMKPHAMHGPRQHTRAMWRPSQGCPLGRCKARLPEVSAGLARGAARPSHPPMRLSLRQFPAVGVDLPWSIPPPFPRTARHGTPRCSTWTPPGRRGRGRCQPRRRVVAPEDRVANTATEDGDATTATRAVAAAAEQPLSLLCSPHGPVAVAAADDDARRCQRRPRP